MNSYSSPEQRRQIIMQRYAHPQNKSNLNNFDLIVYHSSTHCVDKMQVGWKIVDQKVVDAKFTGEGCAIFLSSVDLFLDQITNLTFQEIREITQKFEQLLFGKQGFDDSLKELNVFANVGAHFNRLHCATMIIDATKKLLDKI